MDIVASVKKAFIKSGPSTNGIIIDNWIFQMHYKITTIILLTFSILVTSKQYIGDPIDCTAGNGHTLPANMLDTFCWAHTTFSIPAAWNKKVGSEIPYPGVDKYSESDDRVYHAYYQWVCFVLFLQAVAFYIPRYFWKSMENGLIRNIILDLNSPMLLEDIKENNKRRLICYLNRKFGQRNYYFMFYVISEVMNFVNVTIQILLTDLILNGEFSTYGLEVVKFADWNWAISYDPMIKIFPRLTKCAFYDFGRSGSVQLLDAMCVLPINIINEKIYVFLWFWFSFLALMSGLNLIYRSVITFSPKARYLVIFYSSHLEDGEKLKKVIVEISVSDWLLLLLLSKNMDSFNFLDIVNGIKTKNECNSNDKTISV